MSRKKAQKGAKEAFILRFLCLFAASLPSSAVSPHSGRNQAGMTTCGNGHFMVQRWTQGVSMIFM
jgi:hypothetical protein